MTLLNAVQNVAAECGYSVDSVVIESADVTTKQLLAIANRVIREMADAYPWPKLFKQYSFSLDAGISTYEKPGDFSQYHYDSWWNQSDGWRVIGPMTPQEYASYQGSNITSVIYDRFQIRGMTDEEITFYPEPTASGEVILFEYLSARPVRPPTWTAGETITAGDYRFYDGNYYTAAGSGTAGSNPPVHTAGSVSDGTITWDYYDGAYETFLADTDEPNLSQRVLEQGMLERFSEIKGISFSPRFQSQLQEEYGKQIQGKTLYADGDYTEKFQYGRNGRVVFGL